MDALWVLLLTLVGSLAVNVYVTGINQLFDISIDRINKPTLPIASGELSITGGWLIVGLCGFLGPVLSYNQGTTYLTKLLLAVLAIGTMYSVPPFRFKRSPLLAAMSISGVRGILVQIGLHLHFNQFWEQHNGSPTTHFDMLPTTVVFAIVFMTLFTIIIAMFKDIPDIEGDRQHNIQSFSVRQGPVRMVSICVYLLMFDYIIAVLVCLFSASVWTQLIMSSLHCVISITVYRKYSQIVQLNLNKQSIVDYYMFIWKLFYLEYFVLPFIF